MGKPQVTRHFTRTLHSEEVQGGYLVRHPHPVQMAEVVEAGALMKSAAQVRKAGMAEVVEVDREEEGEEEEHQVKTVGMAEVLILLQEVVAMVHNIRGDILVKRLHTTAEEGRGGKGMSRRPPEARAGVAVIEKMVRIFMVAGETVMKIAAVVEPLLFVSRGLFQRLK